MTREEAKEIAAIVIRDMEEGEYVSVKSYKLLAALKALIQSPWIPVEERLPEEQKYEETTIQKHREWTESEDVLVLTADGHRCVTNLYNGKWRFAARDCDNFPITVTHWMPLPELTTQN